MIKTLDKKTDGSKLTSLFELRKCRVGLDCNCRDKEYIEAIQKALSSCPITKLRYNLQEKG